MVMQKFLLMRWGTGKLPGYEFRRLKQFADDEIWKAFEKEVDDEWE